MTYKIVYQMGELEMTGFSSVDQAVTECASWSDEDQIAMTEDVDGYADIIINEETGETVCFLADKKAICEKFDIVPGESFVSGLTNVETYSEDELLNLK